MSYFCNVGLSPKLILPYKIFGLSFFENTERLTRIVVHMTYVTQINKTREIEQRLCIPGSYLFIGNAVAAILYSCMDAKYIDFRIAGQDKIAPDEITF